MNIFVFFDPPPSLPYPLYMARWELSPIVVTIVSGVYGVAVLLALLVAGRLSGHLGRRPGTTAA